MNLTSNYRPQSIADFVGLETPQKIFSKFIQNPTGSTWLAFGPSGTGKTAFGLALAKELGVGELSMHHIASQACGVDAIKQIVGRCWMRPMSGRFHFVLVDEIAEISRQAQTCWLSFLDATEMPPDTIFFFTCNQDDDPKRSNLPPESLEPRFVSRTRPIKFSTYGMNGHARELLERVWKAEAPDAPAPDFYRILKDQNNNVRAALNALEMEILCAGGAM